MVEYDTIVRFLKSDLRWCLKHQDDKDQEEPDNKFNSGYCRGRIELIKDLIAEIEVLRMKEEINNE